jgi:hypothetical protein
MDTTADFIERLIKAPGRTLELLPGGKAHAEKLATLEVGDAANRQAITCWSVTGISNSPTPVWTDAKGRFFGINFGIAWLPAGYEDLLKRTEKAQDDAFAAEVARISRSLPRIPKGPVAFTGVRLYDADAIRFLADQTIVVDGGRIVAVGRPRRPGARRRRTHRRARQDARARSLGRAHARRRRLHRPPGTLDGRHLGAIFIVRFDAGRRAPRQGRASPCLSVLADRRRDRTAQVANVATSDRAIALVNRGPPSSA